MASKRSSSRSGGFCRRRPRRAGKHSPYSGPKSFAAQLWRRQIDRQRHRRAQIERRDFELNKSCFDLRIVENIVDDAQQVFAALADGLRVFRLLASSGVARSRSVIPMTPFIGVRISWLMLPRNSPLCRLADSARLRSAPPAISPLPVRGSGKPRLFQASVFRAIIGPIDISISISTRRKSLGRRRTGSSAFATMAPRCETSTVRPAIFASGPTLCT